MTEVDLIIKNAHVFNVYLRKFQDVQVSIKNGKFYLYIGFEIYKEIDNDTALSILIA